MAAAAQEEPSGNGKKPFWHGLGFQVLVGMVLGALVGVLWPEVGAPLKLLGDIFLRLVKTIVAPLVFLTVAGGIISAGDFKRVGRVSLISLVYFEIVSTLALIIGMGVGILTGVGKGAQHLTVSAAAIKGANTAQTNATTGAHTTLSDTLLNIFPDNFLGAFVKGEILQVLVLALLFGAGVQLMKKTKRDQIDQALGVITPAMYSFTHVIMMLAPVGAFGAMAYTLATNGMSVLIALAWWVAVYYLTQIAFIVILHGIICLVFRVNLFDILRYIKDEILVVLGTASSESALPRLLEKMPAYGVSNQVVGLVLPTGYVFNLGGAAIYLSMGVIFLSNAYNVHLSWAQLAGILGLMLLTSKGVATVAGGSFVTFAATATAVGILPLEGLPLMFGVYRLMAPANSTANAVSNAIATVIIGKMSGEYDPSRRVPLAALEV
jgi:aerobic C4-dicarboxylate transport protein